VLGFGESGDRGAQVSPGIVPELADERVLIERSLDQGTLHATATAVNQPDLAESSLMRCAQILLNHFDDIPRRKGMQVEGILKGQFMCTVRHSTLHRT
jgi:hypothetical protein